MGAQRINRNLISPAVALAALCDASDRCRSSSVGNLARRPDLRIGPLLLTDDQDRARSALCELGRDGAEQESLQPADVVRADEEKVGIIAELSGGGAPSDIRASATGIPPVVVRFAAPGCRRFKLNGLMDARTYFELTDAIAAATDRGELDALRERVDETEMHPMERRVLERVLRSRLDMLRLGKIVVLRPKPERAD